LATNISRESAHCWRIRTGAITRARSPRYTPDALSGEGVAAELIKEIIKEAKARKLKYVFACTSEERAARFFQKLKFRRVGPDQVTSLKWRGYDSSRIERISIFRLDLM